MELNMRYATTADGVRIAYAVAGKGLPVIRAPFGVFSHCQLEWRQSDFYERLTQSRMVIPFDPRGSGLSDRNVDDLSIDAGMLDIDAVASAAGLDRFALHGIGSSGPLVITYAVRHPERVTHLILDDIFILGTKYTESPQVLAIRQLLGAWESFTETLAFLSLGVGGEDATRYAEYLRACTTPDIAEKWFAVQETVDVSRLLPQIRCPTLLMQHKGVRGLSLPDVQEAAKIIPDARFAVIEGKQGAVDPVLTLLSDFLGDEAPSPPADRTTVAPAASRAAVQTVLFTDIVGHTEMMQRLGDTRGRGVLREHERITREALQKHGGAEVKTDGDSFMATFSSASSAVECAVWLQRAFARHSEEHDEPIVVRIGLNVGEPIEEDGDFFGSAVILAARIKEHAAGGEILVPEALRHMLSGKNFLFSDRGEFVPKGFEDAVRLYEVRWRE
jgi:class 3 adenylate cyclase/pimeloyl-ACP methyl ester carboxylesterase